ncbi:MAG: hypothetical protein QOE70_5783 [Chthoniobacter sp.]|jgi:hypothetical protein|nr:hypothetical protein [Chthoniobacter sp.]
MLRRFVFTIFVLLACAFHLYAIDGRGTIKKVDADNGTIVVAFTSGQVQTLKVAKDARFAGLDDKDMADGLKAKELKEGAAVTVMMDPDGRELVLKVLYLGDRPKGGKPKITDQPKTGFKPLDEMTAQDKYKGEDGGLYGSGKNEPSGTHAEAAKKETAKIVLLDVDGKPSKDGKIVLISISMSNATAEFSTFKPMADKDPQKSPLLTIVDCAISGQAMAEWSRPDARPWSMAEDRLRAAGVTPKQVQIAWIKLANVRPTGELTYHGKRLQKDTVAVLNNAKQRYPNLRIAYLGSRIYGGWAVNDLNPEPYAYEGAFACRWLIQDQIKGNPDLNYDSSRGAVKSPLLLWGPYFWADGLTPRKSDGLIWEKKDLGNDGTHPSGSGCRKVAGMLLKFFETDSNARTWFVKK